MPRQFSREYTTGELRQLMNEYASKIAHSEHIKIKDNWILVKHGVKLLVFNKVSPNRWRNLISRVED